ncbi:MAG: SufS family cysteine desulfurase [Acidobacteria bacterium]|nr:SufS family cysteine desulfurase [Acidobacteriota bacterium]
MSRGDVEKQRKAPKPQPSATEDRWPEVSRRFPALQRSVNAHRLVYLDTAATAQKPDGVIAAQQEYYRSFNANVHRGIHTLAEEATAAYEHCRARAAQLVAAPSPSSLVITRNATASLNMVARGLEHTLHEGDEVLLTEMEHHANLVPWIMLAQRTGIVLRHIPITDDGKLDLSKLDELLTARTRIVSLMHVSNVLGTINPVAEVAEAAHARGATVVVDAAQSVGHLPVDMVELGVDALAYSAHKCYGPMGLGFLAAKPELLDLMEPMEGGGEMINEVFLDRATWAEPPLKFEAGTPNVASAAAFPAAVDMLEEIGLEAVRRHEEELAGYALERLSSLPGLVIYGPTDPAERGGLVSFHDPEVHPHDMATLLDQAGVAVRAGHHCAQPLHRRLGVVATTRASLGVYSSKSDVDALYEGIRFARRYFNP